MKPVYTKTPTLDALAATNPEALAELITLRNSDKLWQWLRVHPEWFGWDSDFDPEAIEREIQRAMASEISCLTIKEN